MVEKRARECWAGARHGLTVAVLAVAMPVLTPCGSAVAAVPLPSAGRTQALVPSAWGSVGDARHELAVDDDVYSDEAIETGPGSAVRIVFRDGTELSVGPSSRVTINRYVYDPQAGRGGLVLNFLSGIFGFVTGSLDHDAYDLRVPTGYLSVRGTQIAIDTGRNLVAVPRGTVQVRLNDGQGFTVSDQQCLTEDRSRGWSVRTGATCDEGLAGYRSMEAALADATQRAQLGSSPGHGDRAGMGAPEAKAAAADRPTGNRPHDYQEDLAEFLAGRRVREAPGHRADDRADVIRDFGSARAAREKALRQFGSVRGALDALRHEFPEERDDRRGGAGHNRDGGADGRDGHRGGGTGGGGTGGGGGRGSAHR